MIQHAQQGLATLTDKITNVEFTELCQRYSHPTMKDHVKWKIFVEDIDQGMVMYGVYKLLLYCYSVHCC